MTLVVIQISFAAPGYLGIECKQAFLLILCLNKKIISILFSQKFNFLI